MYYDDWIKRKCLRICFSSQVNRPCIRNIFIAKKKGNRDALQGRTGHCGENFGMPSILQWTSIQQTYLSYKEQMLLEHHYQPSSWLCGKAVEVSNLSRLLPTIQKKINVTAFQVKTVPHEELSVSVKFYLVEVIEIISSWLFSGWPEPKFSGASWDGPHNSFLWNIRSCLSLMKISRNNLFPSPLCRKNSSIYCEVLLRRKLSWKEMIKKSGLKRKVNRRIWAYWATLCAFTIWITFQVINTSALHLGSLHWEDFVCWNGQGNLMGKIICHSVERDESRNWNCTCSLSSLLP